MPKVVETQSFTNSRQVADWVKTKLQSAGSPWSLVYTATSTDTRGAIYYFSNNLYTIGVGGTSADGVSVEGATMSKVYLYFKLLKTKNADGTEVPTGQSLYGDYIEYFPSSQTWLLTYTQNTVVFRCNEMNKTYGFTTISPATDISAAVCFVNTTNVVRALNGTTSVSGSLVSLSQTGTQAYTGGLTDIALLPYHILVSGKVFPRCVDLYLPVGQSQAFLDEVTDGTNNYVIFVPNTLAVRY